MKTDNCPRASLYQLNMASKRRAPFPSPASERASFASILFSHQIKKAFCATLLSSWEPSKAAQMAATEAGKKEDMPQPTTKCISQHGK